MRRFIEGLDRGQNTLFPECLEDWIGEDNPVRVIDVFVDELDLAELGFEWVDPEASGRPSTCGCLLLKDCRGRLVSALAEPTVGKDASSGKKRPCIATSPQS